MRAARSRRTFTTKIAGVLAISVSVLIACGGKGAEPSSVADAGATSPSATPGTDAGRPPFFVEPCSDGPRWPNGSPFEYEHDGPVTAPACTPHCGPNASASSLWGPPDLMKLTTAALPSGGCEHDGNTCTMGAEWLGVCPPGGRAVGPLDLFICRCTTGRWGCTVDDSSPSDTAQTCDLPEDAGADGEP